MQRVDNAPREVISRRRSAVLAVASVTALIALSACTSGSSGTGTGASQAPAGHSSSASSTASSPAPATSSSSSKPTVSSAVISADAVGGVRAADPGRPIAVKIANGTLTSVRMTNPSGKTVTGAMSADGTSWQTNEALGYSKTYSVTATGHDAEGSRTTKTEQITTLTPNNQTMPYIEDIYGTAIGNGATYGVGMVVRVHFDESVDHAKAQKTLTVTTNPASTAATGSWFWDDDQNVYWRPEHYYAPGTKVTVSAKVYGAEVGSGLYGQADQSASFRIGAKHYSVADAKTHQVKVYFNDKLVRTMPTSMGQGGYVQGKNGQISLWTMPGVYTVINHENPATMSSDSYGLPSTSAYGYPPEKVYWSTKISTDGIYLHELDTTVWAQGHQNVSHGCLNLNYTNAHWFYQHSEVGDVVTVVHSGGPKIEFWQGGQWSVPWSHWKAGSAL